MPLLSLSGRRPKNIGVRDGKLAPCPSKPNCVCSDCDGKGHAIAPLAIGDRAPDQAWEAVKAAVGQLKRTEVVTESDTYLHAESRSWLCGFVDDLELHLRPDDGVIAVRCAARLGYSDLGVNRRRVEALRASFEEASKAVGSGA